MPEQRTVINTRSGVESADQPGGTIEVTYGDGSTSVELFTDDGMGNATRVSLGWHDVAHLMIALGAAGAGL